MGFFKKFKKGFSAPFKGLFKAVEAVPLIGKPASNITQSVLRPIGSAARTIISPLPGSNTIANFASFGLTNAIRRSGGGENGSAGLTVPTRDDSVTRTKIAAEEARKRASRNARVSTNSGGGALISAANIGLRKLFGG